MKTLTPTSGRGGASANHARYVVQRGRCFYCGARRQMGELTQDHVLPRRKGGTNAAENVVLADPKCNADKSDRLPTRYEVNAAAATGRAVKALLEAWTIYANGELAHMGSGQGITTFVDRAMAGKEPEPMESTDG